MVMETFSVSRTTEYQRKRNETKIHDTHFKAISVLLLHSSIFLFKWSEVSLSFAAEDHTLVMLIGRLSLWLNIDSTMIP